MVRPKFVSLDNSSWSDLARKRGLSADRIFRIFADGAVVPFFTSFHIWELFQHANRRVIDGRIEMLRALPFLGFIPCIYDSRSPGNIIDLQEHEIAHLKNSPLSNLDSTISATRPYVTAGFCSGAEFWETNEEKWRMQRDLFPDFSIQNAEVASLAHFPLPGVNLGEKVPLDSSGTERKTPEEVKEFYGSAYEWLVQKLKTDGDPRLNEPLNRQRSPESAAARFLRESYDEAVELFSLPGDTLENILSQSGVERSRLPTRPTIQDIGYESQFIGHLTIHERRLKLPKGTLKQFARQEQVPSWIVIREIDKTVKRLQKAEGSSFVDKMTVPFALYLDAVEVDKRIMDCVRQATRSHAILGQLQTRIFRKRSLEDLLQKLEELSGA